MRVLISGAGAVSHLHALAYRACGCEVAAVWDPDPDRAATFVSVHGGEVAAGFGDLASRDAEVAAVCGPPPSHVEQALALATGGRTVFVEKPVATTRDGIASLLGAPGVVPVVQWRAGRALRAVRAAVAEGLLGQDPTAAVDLAWCRGPSYFTTARSTWAGWGAGALLSVGVHAIDAVSWALGRPVSAGPGLLVRRSGIEVETAATATLDLGGAAAALRVTFDAGANTTRLAFCGNGVTAVISGTDSDPTAGSVQWAAADPAVGDRLRELEDSIGEPTVPPLHVPFLTAALSQDAGTPAVADVAAAHEVALAVYEAEPA